MATINSVGVGLQGTTGSGSFVGSTNPAFSGGISTPGINDSNGNNLLILNTAASAVNYFRMSNASTTNAPYIFAEGADPNIDFTLSAKGDSEFILNTMAVSATPLVIYSGTGGQHSSGFNFANTAANRNYTFPDIDGGVQLQSQAIVSSPPASGSSTLAVGSAYQNTLGYDVVLTVYVAVSAATTASILLGVGPTNTPTQQTIVSGLTLAALNIIPVTIYLPYQYYALLSTSGTITQTISGQQVMPV